MPQCPHCTADVAPGNVFCGRCGSPVSISPEATTVVMANSAAARLRPASTADEGRFPPGTILSQRYRVSARLGKGGMGEVYRATDLLLGQSVALKFLPEALGQSQIALERLRGEVRVTRQISHPNVCRVYDLGEAGGHTFLTMEYIDGEDLASLLRRIGRLPSVKALEIARRLCAGLAAAHGKGVLHRDLKPANIMLDGRGQVLITDFGLAIRVEEVSRNEIGSGTPAYMAPEQLAGVEVTERSDIYALGLVLFELFAGAPPHEATGRELLMSQRQVPPPALADVSPGVDPALNRVVARCLDPIPANRPPSVLAVAAALPGGDPLAAALAMGETPSPDLVAAAEPSESMRPGVAATWLCALMITTLTVAWVAGSISLFAPFAADLEPAATAQTARDILGKLGYPDRPVWTDWSLEVDGGAITELLRQSPPAVRRRIAQDPPLYFWYRGSPNPMISTHPFQPFATYGNPTPSGPGDIRLKLDYARHLQALTAIPLERTPAEELPPLFEWKRLFDAAGLNPTQFEPASPIWTPPSAFDARAGWLQKNASDPIRIEAAAWRGRPVFFRTELESRSSAPSVPESANAYLIYRIGLLCFVSVLGGYNFRRGRSDLPGAARFGLFMTAAAFVRIFLMAPHPAGIVGFYVFVAITGNALWAGVTGAVGYLALEPAVRRWWPHALIAWTRLLNGRFRDPVVGQHLLLGLLVGAGVMLVVLLLNLLEWGSGFPGWTYLLFPNASHAVQGILSSLISAAVETPWLFCLLFVAVRVLRNKWIGVSITAIILTASYIGGTSGPILVPVIVLALAFGLLSFALRYGLLALVTAMFTFDLLRGFPLTLDTSAFYFSTSLAAVLTVLGLGVYAYRASVAGRRLWN
jgi:serine/threonine-protein kinase